MIVNNKSLNVKAVGEYSSYLMIECFRYDDQGNYSYRNHNNEVIQVDGYVLVRVITKPEIDETDFNNRNAVTFMTLFAQRNSKRTIQYEILGAIDHQSFWEIKKYAPEGMKCTGSNLWKIASGNNEDIEMVEDGDNIPKNMRLQKDNYIVHKSKLNPLEKMLKKHS